MNALIREARPLLVALLAFSLCINLLFLVPAVFTLQVFDRVLPTASLDTLVVLLAGTGVALLLLAVLDHLRVRLQGVAGLLVEDRLAPPVVRAVVAASARATHAAPHEAVRDVAAVRGLLSANGIVALLDAPWVVVYVGVIALFHPLLGLGAAVCALAMLVLAWAGDRLGRAPQEAVQVAARRASRWVEGSVRNAEVLQTLGMTEALLGRWRSLQDEAARRQAATATRQAAFAATARFLRQAVQVLMMSLGAWLVLSQQASPGVMIATTILLGRAVQPVEQLVASWRALAEGRAAWRRLRAMGPELEPRPVRVNLPRPTGRLVAEGLVWRPPGSERPVLAGVGLALAAGESLAIIGPSGAGKSTLARLLTGVWAPATGTVRLDGADLADWPRERLGPMLGYVPQDVELFDGTVADNIARLGPVDDIAVVAAARRAAAHELILGLPRGYETPVGEGGTRLSPGQRQRIALARALYGNPTLVVLDEPNASLDGEGESALARALAELRAEGVTVVVVSHRPSLIAHVDRILVLEAGRVVRFGPRDEVMQDLRRKSQAMVADVARSA